MTLWRLSFNATRRKYFSSILWVHSADNSAPLCFASDHPKTPSPLFPSSELMHSSLTAPHSWCLSCLLKKVRAKQSCLSAQKSLQVLKKESTVGLCYIIKEESKEQKKRQNSQDGRKEGNVLWKKRGLRKRTGTLHTQHHTVLWPPPWTKTTQD